MSAALVKDLEAKGRYRKHLDASLQEDPSTAQEFSRLLGSVNQGEHFTLICWCSSLPCHADVIKELLETHADPAGE